MGGRVGRQENYKPRKAWVTWYFLLPHYLCPNIQKVYLEWERTKCLSYLFCMVFAILYQSTKPWWQKRAIIFKREWVSPFGRTSNGFKVGWYCHPFPHLSIDKKKCVAAKHGGSHLPSQSWGGQSWKTERLRPVLATQWVLYFVIIFGVCLFWDSVSYSSGWPWTHFCVPEGDLEILICPSNCWNYRYASEYNFNTCLFFSLLTLG